MKYRLQRGALYEEEKKKPASIRVIAVIALLSSLLSACNNAETVESNPQYLADVSQYTFWTNSAETSIPEYQTYNHVHDFLDVCKIKDDGAVAPNGKIRKVLFIGFDGMRADALPYVLDNAGNSKTGVSGIAELQQSGGLYLAYCGGETGTDTEQTTSTPASWTSHFTGVWGAQQGIKTNEDSKNMQYKTFMLEFAEKGLNTSIAFDWDQYFDVNLKEEIKYVMEADLPMQFCDIAREKRMSWKTPTPKRLNSITLLRLKNRLPQRRMTRVYGITYLRESIPETILFAVFFIISIQPGTRTDLESAPNIPARSSTAICMHIPFCSSERKRKELQ